MTRSDRALAADLAHEERREAETLRLARLNPLAYQAYLDLSEVCSTLEHYHFRDNVLAIARRRELTGDEQEMVREALEEMRGK